MNKGILFAFFISLALVEATDIVGLQKLNDVKIEGKIPRIIGGSPALAPMHRYVAAVWLTKSNGNYFCGGNVLNNLYILTAGQCVYDVVQFTVQIGSVILNDPGAIRVATNEFIVYPEFDPATLHHDIGLIQFRQPVEFNDWITPIHLLPTRETEPNTLLSAAGWGQISDSSSAFAEELQSVAVTAISNEECERVFIGQIRESMICAEGNYNEGVCYGDIGNALTEVQKTGARMVVAIASFISGNGCESLDPSGFTRVYPYNDWITETSGATNLL